MAHPRKTPEQFIRECKAIFPHYDYSKTSYIVNRKKVTVTCPEHGDFQTWPGSITSLRKGCQRCAWDKGARKKVMPFDKFVARARKLHNGLYEYPPQDWQGVRGPLTIICPDHGEVTVARAYTHTKPKAHQTGGCKKCASDQLRRLMGYSPKQLENKFRSIHGEAYTYDLSGFTNVNGKVLARCPEHGEWTPTVSDHLRGSGCPSCKKTGFVHHKPAELYLVEIEGLYKVGVTNKTLEQRYCLVDLNRMTVILRLRFDTGKEAQALEGKIIEQNKHIRYDGPPVLTQTGTTEMFTQQPEWDS